MWKTVVVKAVVEYTVRFIKFAATAFTIWRLKSQNKDLKLEAERSQQDADYEREVSRSDAEIESRRRAKYEAVLRNNRPSHKPPEHYDRMRDGTTK